MRTIEEEIRSSIVEKMEIPATGVIRSSFRFSNQFTCFKGHFPEYPILPAFIQLMMVKLLMEIYKGCPLELERLKNAKFRIPIRPEQNIVVECRERFIENKIRCDVSLAADDQIAATFQMIFADKRISA